MAEDHIYIIRGSPNSGDTANGDRCYKRLKTDLSEVAYYGGRGTGNDQLQCPWSVTVDDTNVWIADRLNNRVMQRLKSDLSYVQKVALTDARTVHTRDGDVVWGGGLTGIYELSKTNLSTVRSILYPAIGDLGRLFNLVDVTSDDTYLYALDQSKHRCILYDLATLSYQAEFGIYSGWNASSYGVAVGGGYLYVSDNQDNKILKVDPATYEILATFGHINGGSGPGYINAPNDLFYSGSKLIVGSTSDDSVRVLDSDLNELATLSHDLLYAPYCAVADANYIYAIDLYGTIHRFNFTTYAYVDITIFPSVQFYGATADADYLYINQNQSKILKIDKSTMASAGSYDDAVPGNFGNAQALTVDGTYVYVSDTTTDTIHRINKTTMAYVDALTPASTVNPMQAAISGTSIYVGQMGGGIQKYALADMSLESQSPATAGDANFWLKKPLGITLDNDYIYIANSSNGDLYKTGGEIKIYDRATRAFVDSFSIKDGAGQIAVDETYLYVPSTDYQDSPVGGIVTKYLKASPYTEIGTVDDRFADSVDTLLSLTTESASLSPSISPSNSPSESLSNSPSSSASISPSLSPSFPYTVINPKVMLQWSDDGGQTWSNEYWRDPGKIGEFRTRLLWRKLGNAKDRVFKIAVSDPCKWRFISAEIDAEPGTRR